MNRRRFLIGGAIAGAAVIAAWLMNGKSIMPTSQSLSERNSMFDRVVFVCTDGGDYSPGVYLHGTGGHDALQFVPEAAPFMRAVEIGDSAAGLCGFLFKVLGDGVARDGGLSLYDVPDVASDGAVDWQTYCGPNVDLILINVEQGTAELFSGSADLKSPSKKLVKVIKGLKFGDED